MRPRSYLMCLPAHYTVSYAINPWMTGTNPVDAGLAMRQWQPQRDDRQPERRRQVMLNG